MRRTAKRRALVRSYTVVFEPLAEGGYNVVVPAIPEVCTFGESLAEAKRMAVDAIRCALEGVARERSKLPPDVRRSPRVQRLAVKLQPA